MPLNFAPDFDSTICLSPRAIYTCPGNNSVASYPISTTVRSLLAFKRSAKDAVNPSGICWTTAMGGICAGNALNNSLRAKVPPVDAPITINSGLSRRLVDFLTTAFLVRPERSAFSKTVALTFAACRTLLRIDDASGLNTSISVDLGLGIKSTAPISNASNVTAAPTSVNVEIITTGNGRKRIMLRKNVIPSIFGISISRVITSGFKVLILSRAS